MSAWIFAGVFLILVGFDLMPPLFSGAFWCVGIGLIILSQVAAEFKPKRGD